MNKKTFDIESEGKRQGLAVIRPTHKISQQATLAYNRAFREAVKPADGKPGAIVRAALEGVLREQKLWDDAKERRFKELNAALLENEKKLARGGIKLSDAKASAIQMRRDRNELRRLISDRNSLDLTTAEAQAENARFNFLVYACTVKADSGKPHWKSEDDYHADDGAAAGEAARHLGNMIYGLDDDFEKKLPENKWLLAYKFCDDSLDFVDEKGRKVDSQGRLLDQNGRFINEEGKFVDAEGELITEQGDYVLEFLPFVDDSGNPVPVPKDELSSPTKGPTDGLAPVGLKDTVSG